MTIERVLRRAVGVVLVCVALAAPVHAAVDTVVVQWDNVPLEAIREAHPGPPIVARALVVLLARLAKRWKFLTRVSGSTDTRCRERTEIAVRFPDYTVRCVPARCAARCIPRRHRMTVAQ